MIKKAAIQKTSINYWSDEDECFVVVSPLFERVAGVGETREEAAQCFRDLLDDAYEHLENDNVAGYKRGRPSKNGVDLHCQVKHETRETVTNLSKKLGGISQGETVDFLLQYYLLNSAKEEKNQTKNSMPSLETRVKNIELVLQQFISPQAHTLPKPSKLISRKTKALKARSKK